MCATRRVRRSTRFLIAVTEKERRAGDSFVWGGRARLVQEEDVRHKGADRGGVRPKKERQHEAPLPHEAPVGPSSGLVPGLYEAIQYLPFSKHRFPEIDGRRISPSDLCGAGVKSTYAISRLMRSGGCGRCGGRKHRAARSTAATTSTASSSVCMRGSCGGQPSWAVT
jgi:hypothetical protein